MIIHQFNQFSHLYRQACQGLPKAVLVTGDAGMGKTTAIQQWLEANPAAAEVCTPFVLCETDTPLSATRQILDRWHAGLQKLYQQSQDDLAQHARHLGLPYDKVEEWLQTLSTREERLQQIRQHLPWLKKMTPGLKADVDRLLDLLGKPWLNIALRRTLTDPEPLDDKTPVELAHVLVDEWLWLHHQLPRSGNDSVWTLWLDNLECLPSDVSTHRYDEWRQWLDALINAVATAEQLKAFLMVSGRAECLSTWVAFTVPQLHVHVVGPLSEEQVKASLQPMVDGANVDPEVWRRLVALTQGNPAWTQLLGLGLTQRKLLLADGLTETRLETLGLVGQQALLDWWLVPLQLTPTVQFLPNGALHTLLMAISRHPGPFSPPEILACLSPESTTEDQDNGLTTREMDAAFSVLQQLYHLQLITPLSATEDDAIRYAPLNRLALEQLAQRFPSPAIGLPEEQTQQTLTHVLEVSLLSGQLDQQQLSDLWQWCLQSPDPDTLKALWINLSERALSSPYQSIVMSGLAALNIAQALTFDHLKPLLANDSFDTLAWRLACELPWPTLSTEQDSGQEGVIQLLQQGLSHRRSVIRACALQCARLIQQYQPLPDSQWTPWLENALQDSDPWVKRQGVLAIQSLGKPEALSLQSLMQLAMQSEPAVLPLVLPLLHQHASPEGVFNLAMAQWLVHDGRPEIQTHWMQTLRQVSLTPPVEAAMIKALQQATAPDLIWTLHQKLWRDSRNEAIHYQLRQLSQQAGETAWPQWLKMALAAKCLTESQQAQQKVRPANLTGPEGVSTENDNPFLPVPSATPSVVLTVG